MARTRKNKADSVADVLFAAAQEGRLFDGELGTCQRTGNAVAGGAAWRIDSLVPPRALSLFRSDSDSCVVTSDALGFGDVDGYWVIGYHVAQTQHRFLLPLVGHQVAAMLDDLSSGGIILQMRAQGVDEGHGVHAPVSDELLAALKAAHRRDVSADSVLPVMLLATTFLLQPESLRPPPGSAVPENVSVTGVLPLDLRP